MFYGGKGARGEELDRFLNRDARILVATDVAARGVDFGGVRHVIQV